MTNTQDNLNCSVAHKCGACVAINASYDQQLARKQFEMEQLFAEFIPAAATAATLKSFVRPILAMSSPFHYRNKVISPFAPSKGKADKGKILTGMYAAGTHRLIDTTGCAVENVAANAVVVAIKRIMNRYKMEPYDEDTGRGFVRHVVVRVGHTTGEMLVTLVTNGAEFVGAKNFCKELVRACPQVTTVVQNINTRQTNVILGEQQRTLYGPGFILDELCGLSFKISSQSFYQVNATQTEVLYNAAMEAAGLTGGEAVIDAYCGTGTIGLVAAKRRAGRVIGVDSVDSAIADARENARHNGIQNAEFVCADATKYLVELAKNDSTCDVLFMDPPRAGSTPQFIAAATALAPKRVVYISCNPQTQVRDLREFAKHGYHVQYVQPVDMFPHTPHVETVVFLSNKNATPKDYVEIGVNVEDYYSIKDLNRKF